MVKIPRGIAIKSHQEFVSPPEQVCCSTLTLTDDGWKPAKPLGITLWYRIKGAWSVLRGKSTAVRWYSNKEVSKSTFRREQIQKEQNDEI